MRQPVEVISVEEARKLLASASARKPGTKKVRLPEPAQLVQQQFAPEDEAGGLVLLEAFHPGRPRGWERTITATGDGQRPNTREHHAWVKSAGKTFGAVKRYPDPYNAPCRLDVLAVFPRPKLLAKADPGLLPFDGPPDYDNIAKLVADALQEARIVANDCRIQKGLSEKGYAATSGTYSNVGVHVLLTTVARKRPLEWPPSHLALLRR